MDENINTSEEIQEVAAPEDALESAETQEVADPVEAEDSTAEDAEQSRGKNDADAAFAEMRRTNQQLERDNQMLMAALARYFEGETAEELSDNANAYAEERDPEEYRAEREHNEEFEAALAENEDLREQLIQAKAAQLMRDDLAVIQEIDPTVESLDELGDTFIKMRLNPEQSLTAKEAYYACKAMQLNEKVLAPDAIGKVADTKAEREFYTDEEINNLTEEELMDDAVYEKVMRSLQRKPKG